jgi:histidinol dehydrogenase
MEAGSIENHRGREKGTLVYPVYSRRSRGLSIGINLFPQRKFCNFDCPYCEVFPFESETKFSIEQMEEELRTHIEGFLKQKTSIRDLCFSGNGEPSLSPLFPAALEKALQIRNNLVSDAAVVVITNGTGLLDDTVYSLLEEKSGCLSIWLKIDAGTEEWFNKINRPNIQHQSNNFELLMKRITNFTKTSPCVIQTMICKVEGILPPPSEEQAWITVIKDIAGHGNLKAVHVYGKARPSPKDPLAETVEPIFLKNRADALIKALQEAAYTVQVEVFD